MSRWRAVHCLLCLILLFGVLTGLGGDRVALAAQEGGNSSFLLSLNQEQPPPEEKLELICKYPVLERKSGDSFEFGVELKWHTSEFRQFNVTTT